MKPIILDAAKRRFLLLMPPIMLPFLCLIFSLLGGGRDANHSLGLAALGLNPQLPKARSDPKQAFLNKVKLYELAEKDSLRRQQYLRQDPYRRDSSFGVPASRKDSAIQREPHLPVKSDPKADQLLTRLDELKKSLLRPEEGGVRPVPPLSRSRSPQAVVPSVSGNKPDNITNDPKVDQLNKLLDKVIRIQHPNEEHAATVSAKPADEVLAADSGVNTISAVTPDDQLITAGATIGLRITDSIRINGTVIPAGLLVYGVVSINNDRILLRINTVREGHNLFACDLQVYDMDGIAGIHIPGALSRDVAKQSADQGVNSLNILTMDPSVGAQAAGAGIQTVKTFVGHKVRQVRVSVRAGYQVLLRPTHASLLVRREGLMFNKPTVGLRPPGW